MLLGIGIYLYVFIVSGLIDFLWIRCQQMILKKRALASAIYGVLLDLAGASIILAYVDDLAYLFPSLLGAFIGNYLTVKLAS